MSLWVEKITYWDTEFAALVKNYLQFDPTREIKKLVAASSRKIFEKESSVKIEPIRIAAEDSIVEFNLDKMPMLSESPTEMDPSFVWSFSSDEEVDDVASTAKDSVLPPLVQMMESPQLHSEISASRRLVISRRHQQYDDCEPMFEVCLVVYMR
jgi:hypothetical protein